MYSGFMLQNLTVEKVLRYAILGGLFLIPLLIPFIVSKTMYFPFITGKNFTFRIIVELLMGGWIILAWRDAAYRLRFSWILAALTVFVGVVTLADIFGEDPLRSFWSNYERMDGLITLLHLFAYFIVLGSMLKDSALLWKRFLQTSLGASVLVSVYGVFQLLGFLVINQGGVRVDATLGNATYFGSYLLFHIFFAALLFAEEKKSIFLRIVYGAALGFQVFMLFNTATRGAVLALVGGVLLVAILVLFGTFKDPSLRKKALGFFLAVVILIGGLIALKDTDFIRSNSSLGRLATISFEEGESRFVLWNMTWQAVKEHPLLGWGQDNFMLTFSKYYDPRMYGQEPWFDRAHNIIFDWLIAGGFLGLLAYLSLFAALLYALWLYPRRIKKSPVKDSEEEKLSLVSKSIITGLLAAYFFQNLFVFDNVMSYILFFSVLAYAHGRTFEKKEKIPSESIKERFYRNEFMDRLIAPAVIVLLILLVYFFNIKAISANQNLLRGIDPSSVKAPTTVEGQKKAFEEKANQFKKALRSPLGRTEAREQLIQMGIGLAGAPIPEETKQQFFNFARNEMSAQIEEVPGNVRYRLFLASLLTAYRLPTETIASLEKALSISPKKQNIHFLLANAYVNQGNAAQAIETLRQAFELEPRNNQARDLYAAVLIRGGKELEAEKLLIEGYGEVQVDDPDIMNAYISIGKFEKVLSFWEKKVEENPNDLQSHVSLAAAYLGAGKRTLAVLELEKMVVQFPSFKEQGEFFIREIKAGRNP